MYVFVLKFCTSLLITTVTLLNKKYVTLLHLNAVIHSQNITNKIYVKV